MIISELTPQTWYATSPSMGRAKRGCNEVRSSLLALGTLHPLSLFREMAKKIVTVQVLVEGDERCSGRPTRTTVRSGRHTLEIVRTARLMPKRWGPEQQLLHSALVVLHDRNQTG
jgi:hypothetical protein